MANVRGTKEVGEGTRSRIFEELVPSSGWTEDSNAHCLLVDLPDFKNEEVKLQVDKAGHITVRGERQVRENKYIKFEQTYKVPENSDINKIRGKFDGEILYVTVQKQIVEKEEPKNVNENINHVAAQNLHEKPNNDESFKKDAAKHNDKGHESNNEKKEKSKKESHVESFSKESIEKWEREGTSPLKTAMRMFCRNKRILITAVVAFSLGVLVSRKHESNGMAIE